MIYKIKNLQNLETVSQLETDTDPYSKERLAIVTYYIVYTYRLKRRYTTILLYTIDSINTETIRIHKNMLLMFNAKLVYKYVCPSLTHGCIYAIEEL